MERGNLLPNLMKTNLTMTARAWAFCLAFLTAFALHAGSPGTLDTSFADPNFSGTPGNLAIDANGKIVAIGAFTTAGSGNTTYGHLARINADGTLDTTFANAKLSGAGSSQCTVTVLSTGKILVAGNFTTVNGTAYTRLARINSDGTLDTTFSNVNATGTIFGAAVDANGKIIIYGSFTALFGGNTAYAKIARLNSDGSVDSSFTPPTADVSFQYAAVASSGKIYIAGGFSTVASTARHFLARLNSDGSLDTTFQDPNLTLSGGNARCVLEDANGKVVVGGNFTTAGTASLARGCLARFNSDGTLDTSFADPNLNVNVLRIVLDTNGKIIASGAFTAAGPSSLTYYSLARLNTDGTVDTAFANPNLTDSTGATAGAANGLALDSSGRILVSGNFVKAGSGGTTYGHMARFFGTTPSTAPTVTTATQSSVTSSSATLGGNVTSDGGATVTDRGIVWATTSNPTTSDTKVANGSGTGSFSATVSSLPANTLIHVRAYAINSVGTSYGSDINFTTLAAAPTISSVTGPANGSYRAGQALSFTANFSAAVTVTGTPYLAVNVGGSPVHANYASGSGGTALVFTYTVQAGDTDADGIASSSPLVLNSGTIKSGGGTDATLTFTPPTTTSVFVDTTAPTISIGAPSASLTTVGPVMYTVTYSGENNITLANGNVTLNTTGNANATVGVSGTGSSRTVTLSGITGDGTLGISIASGTASDTAGNSAAAAGPSTTFTVDNTAPGISIGSPSASLTSGGPVTYTVTYSGENNITLANGNVTLNTTGNANATVGVSGTGSTRTVTLSGITGDGTLGISIAGGTASDTAGNFSAAAGPSATFTVDNTAPGIAISAPSVSTTTTGPVTYTVTYSGENSITLGNGDITLNKTGNADAGSVAVTGTGSTRTVTLSSLSGVGTLGISVAAGTASDTVGNLASSAGPSMTFDVVPSVQSSTVNLANTLQKLTITGSHFDPTAANNTVVFNEGMAGTVTAATATTLTVQVTTAPTRLGILRAGVTTDGVSSGPPVQIATLVPFGPGVVDPNFVTDYAGSAAINALAVQPDGKIIVAGTIISIDGTTEENIARLNADGTLDTSFSATADSYVFCVAVQPDGKILLGGSFTTVNGALINHVARLNADGSTDGSFLTGATLGPDDDVNSIGLQSNGQIVLGGHFNYIETPGNNFVTVNNLARLNTDGSLDSAFTTNAGTGANSYLLSVLVEPDDSILIGGGFYQFNGMAVGYYAHLSADGVFDTTFNPGGAGADSDVNAMALQSDGKVILVGSFANVNTSAERLIARVNADGTPDSTFNAGTPNGSIVYSAALQADGKVVVGGSFTDIDGQGGNGVARLNANGSFDGTFAVGTGAFGDVFGVALQSDGEVLVGGTFNEFSDFPQSLLVRLGNDPATQTVAVPTSGQVTWQRGGSAPEVNTVSFSLSTDSGTNWTPLGTGARVTGGWALSGLSLPNTGIVRAQGTTKGGQYGGSTGIVEQQQSYSVATVTTTAASGATLTGAVLNGSVNPNGTSMTVTFEYGLTPAYGTVVTATQSPVSGSGDQAVSATLTGLTPNTTYHFHAVGNNTAGITDGGDLMFTTAPDTSAPTDISLSPATVLENQAVGTTVGTLTAPDPDAALGDTASFSLVTGTGDTDNSSFSILGNTVQTAAVFDYETKNSYSIRVRVTDVGGLTFEKALTIAIGNVNEPPAYSGYGFNCPANTSVSVLVSKIIAKTSDPEGTTRVVTSVDSVSLQGGTVALLSGPPKTISYTPPAGYVGDDSFEVRISDGVNIITGIVTVTVGSTSGNGTALVSVTMVGPDVVLKFAGIPGTHYQVQRSGGLTPPVTWTTLTTVTADASGFATYTDPSPPSPSYWRTVTVP